MRAQNDPPTTVRQDISRPYRRALWWTSVIWIVVVAASMSRDLIGITVLPEVRSVDALTIAIASLLIAYASMMPGLFDRRSFHFHSGPGPGRDVTELRQSGQRQTGLLVAGVMIRSIGTVALFLTCRYQMATPIEAVAAMTIGWYVLLTFVDVLVVARELPRASGDSAAVSTSPGHSETSTAVKA